MKTQLRFGCQDFQSLHKHLFRDDGEEHGAVIAARKVRTPRGMRLLVRRVFLAQDGTDFILGRNGYALTPLFVAETADYCRDHGCAWLSVHNHGPGDRVRFSPVDRASHERLYPALLDLVRQPVGALVLATRALAGEVWMPDGTKRSIEETVVVGNQRLDILYPEPPPLPLEVEGAWARQALLLGPRGQALLRNLKVAVIGAGGGGSIDLVQLNHLAIGEVIAIDSDRVDISNLSRVLDSTRLDALAFLAESRSPLLESIARRLARPKVRIAGRAARRANRRGHYRGIVGDIRYAETAREMIDCDFIFLATDTMTSRLLFNIVCHQFLIPGIQNGTKIPVSEDGRVGPIHVAVRPVTPDTGCLSCAGAISQRLLHEESLAEDDLRRQRYVEDSGVDEPSVITLNTLAAGHAVTDFLFYVTGLFEPGTALAHQFFEPQSRSFGDVGLPKDPECPYCGRAEGSAYAGGDARALPTLRRSRFKRRGRLGVVGLLLGAAALANS